MFAVDYPFSDPNPAWIANNAMLFGSVYAAFGVLIGWFFVRKISRNGFILSGAIGIACVCPSTVVGFYLFPLLVYSVFRTEHSWFIAGLVAVFTGIPSAATEYLVLRYLFRCTLRRREVAWLLAWKASTLALCISYAILLIFLVNSGPAD